MLQKYVRCVVLVVLLLAAIGVQPVHVTRAAVCTVGGGSPTHPNLEAALADPTCDPINLAPGTYSTASAQVVITRDVSVVGTGAGPGDVTIVPTQNTGAGNTNARGWFWITNGATVNWQNVTFDGTGHQIFTALNYGNVPTVGPTGNGTIQQVVIRNMRYQLYLGFGIGVYHGSTITVTNVTMSNIERVGIHVRGSGGTGATAAISGFTYTGKGAVDGLDYDIEFGGGGNGTVTNSAISNNTAVASDGSTSAGILVTTYFGPGTSPTITNSVFTGNTVGVHVGYDGADTSTVVANNNCLIDNGTGVYTTAPAVNAENNWWNDPAGPTVGGFNGVNDPLIDFDPFLTVAPAFCALVPPAVVPPAAGGPTAEDHANAQAPLCADLDGSTNEIIRAVVPSDTVPNGGVYCRVINADGAYVLDYGPAEVGNLNVINLGVLQAVDVFGMRGAESVPAWSNSVQVCLRGAGTFWYLGALDAPRVPVVLPSAPNGLGYTCATIHDAGTVVLVP